VLPKCRGHRQHLVSFLLRPVVGFGFGDAQDPA